MMPRKKHSRGLRKKRSHGFCKRRVLIHELFEFALQNFNALDELFQEMGLNKGCQLSEFDFRRALTKLESEDRYESVDQEDMMQSFAHEPCKDQLLEFGKFEMTMLR